MTDVIFSFDDQLKMKLLMVNIRIYDTACTDIGVQNKARGPSDNDQQSTCLKLYYR